MANSWYVVSLTTLRFILKLQLMCGF